MEAVMQIVEEDKLPRIEDTDLIDQVRVLRTLVLEIRASYQTMVRKAFEAGYAAGLEGEQPLEAYFKFTNGSN